MPEDSIGNFDGESRVHWEPLKALKQPKKAIKEVFQGPEDKDQIQPANIVLSTMSEVLNIQWCLSTRNVILRGRGRANLGVRRVMIEIEA